MTTTPPITSTSTSPLKTQREAIIDAIDAYYLGSRTLQEGWATRSSVGDVIDRLVKETRPGELMAPSDELNALDWPNPGEVGILLFMRSLERDGYHLHSIDRHGIEEPVSTTTRVPKI